jgi:hypothetical protein
MAKGFSILTYLLSGTSCAAIVAGAVIFAQENLKSEKNDAKKDVVVVSHEEGSLYRTGDWTEYILKKQNSSEYFYDETKDKDIFEMEGNFSTGFLYGKSHFTDKKYRLSDIDTPQSQVIKDGFVPTTDFRMLLQGHAGKRLTVYIDHDSKRANQDENKYIVQYRAVRDDEVLRELNAGDVDVKVAKSKYAIFESKAEKAYGIDMTFRKNNFEIKGFGSVAKGSNEVEQFRGRSATGSMTIAEYQYIRDTYFQLEPYRRFDNITNPSSISFPAAYSSLITFTSKPADSYSFSPYSVSIESGTVEVWCDDQSGTTKNGIYPNPPGGGAYVKLAEGADFTINYATGEIVFLKSIGAQSKIFVGYRLSGGVTASSDPAARTDVIPGKIFVFIKYGTQIEEDTAHDGSGSDKNNDGRINHDIYEIKSRYYIGDKNILPDNCSLNLYRDNKYLTASDMRVLGRFNLDYQNGILAYYLREPFRSVLSTEDATRIYGAYQSRVYESSHYSQKTEYYRSVNSYQLRHTHIISGSITIKVNNILVSPSLYTVNLLFGIVEFPNSGNPVIGESTQVEISYQYSSQGTMTQSFVGGFRGDYRVNESLSVGGTLLYSQQGSDNKVPFAGEEPTRTVVFEGDSSLNIGPSKFGSIASAVTGEKIHDLPLEFNGYAEYARSFKNTNTFGKMMIDDMESASDIAAISLSEKDWILSSMPSGYTRGLLYYKYYRSPSATTTLHNENFSPYSIDYSAKPGPYNIQGGHNTYSNREMNEGRRSLVLDFDFTSSNCVSTAVRIDKKETDLSALQYVEVWYRAAAGSGDVDLSFDIGSINEDSDGDGVLDTEDQNHNGYLDIDPNSNLNEDVGYMFNPSDGSPATRVGGGPRLNSNTIGDGVLTTEDLNGNGLLDTIERVVTFPSTKAFKDNDISYSPLTVALSDTVWKSTRIYLRKNSLSDSDIQSLAHSWSLRINIKKGTSISGKIWIDSINLVSAKWGNVKIDDISNDDPDRFKTTVVDTINDSDYRNHSFLKEKRSLYESLYGDMSSADLNDAKESSLSIKYNLSGSTGSISRKFLKAVDLGYYKTLAIWLDPREVVAGDTMTLRIGSSDSDFITYTFPIDYSGFWQEITFRLKDGSSGKYSATSITGNPIFSRIKYIRFDIKSTGSGTIWVNNIMSLDPQNTSGSAYWYEGTIKSRRPLYITSSGTPIASNIMISYVQHRHDAEYSSPGRTDDGLYERSREIKTACTILPHLESFASFVYNETAADSFNEKFSSELRGHAANGKYLFQIEYGSTSLFIPSVWLTYSNEAKKKSAEDFLQEEGSKYISSSKNKIHSPRLAIEEKIVDFFGGRWVLSIISDNTYQLKTDKKDGSDIDEVQKEGRQRNDFRFKLNYEIGFLSLSPELNMLNNEITQYVGKSSTNEIAGDLNGSFHFPFLGNPDNFKFSERNVSGSLKMATRDIQKVSPSIIFGMRYLQNNFYDFNESEKSTHQDYSRQHGAQSASIAEINIPFTFYEPVFFGCRSVSISYSRKMNFDETFVPYEGESKGLFNERYGITNFISNAGSKAYNLINFYPGYFLSGRGSFARGRDNMMTTLNNPIYYKSGDKAPYSNSLKLMENFSVSPVLKFKNIDLVFSTGFDHLCERSSVESVPGQQFTINSKEELSLDILGLFLSENSSGSSKKRGLRFSEEYGFSRTMLLTSNIREDRHSPGSGVTFFWNDSVIAVKGSFDYRFRKTFEYISSDPTKRNNKDDIYFNAMSKTVISEKNIGYMTSIKYETDLLFLYNFFSSLYALTGNPRISLEYEFIKNKYDYKTTVSPEPYDRYLFTSKLSLDIHKNIKGGISGRIALEKWYNRETKNLYREVFSYELGGQITLQW